MAVNSYLVIVSIDDCTRPLVAEQSNLRVVVGAVPPPHEQLPPHK